MIRQDPKPVRPQAKLHYSFLKILSGSDLSRRRLPLMSAIGPEPGPVVWLTACGHGDEVSGMAIVQEVFRGIRRRLVRGAVHAFPLMNPLGFEMATRNISISREDLNRSFPGNAAGSLGERIADRIFTAILETEPTIVLDLHNDWIESMPYVLVDCDPGSQYSAAYERAITAGRDAGFCVIIDTDDSSKTLSYNLLVRGIPALTLELGQPRIVSETNVTHGVAAVWNIMAALTMIEPTGLPFRYVLPANFGNGRLLRYSDKPYGSKTGMVRFLAKPGDEVKRGQPLAKIVNAFGRHQETVTALDDALVLGHTDSSAAFPGMPIMAFGVAEKNGDGGA